jgi:hypothetical protein
MMRDDLLDCLAKIEDAIDEHPRLTRMDRKTKGFKHRPELTFTTEGWIAGCSIRSEEGKGRGSRTMTDAKTRNWHNSPESATAEFIDSLGTWDIVLS